ncbi:MAG: HAMP domain-containing sensor histidine kinase [Candidatus Zophobacter franzmannii]|nr:HAMP domain-containing sensor histidine kinase [Candidatus Zophobacter franzmannii]
MVKVINQSGNRLLNTLNLILNLSRVEANSRNIKLSRFNLNQLIAHSVTLFQSVASQKGLELIVNYSPSLVDIESDNNLVEHIVNELINNAVKYSNSGIVLVSTKIENDSFVIIVVQDNGIGIPKELQGIIFDAFRQASEGWDRTFEGSGLGLTICKKYATLLGGKIAVESEMEKGK